MSGEQGDPVTRPAAASSAQPLTPAEAATVQRAADAAEALRERVARALWDAECEPPFPWGEADTVERSDYYRFADAALRVIAVTPAEAATVQRFDNAPDGRES